jgi:non-heme chloroperoxidase
MATAQAGVPELRLATTRLATGPQVHYAEQGEAGGKALLLLHGWPDSWFSFSRVMPLLAAKGCHVYALSQRGFGDSERPDSGYTINDFAADASAFMDAIGVSRATLVGHSMGSFVARRVVELYPERAARLVLIGSAVTAVNEVLLAVREEVRSLKDPVSPDFAREFQASTAYAPLPEPFFERIVVESLKLPAPCGAPHSTECSLSTTHPI